MKKVIVEESVCCKFVLWTPGGAVVTVKTKIKPSHSRTSGAADDADLTEVDSASGFMSRTLMVLKGKTNPETRLATEDLQVVHSNWFS